jgi:hypothetical protein
MFQICAVPAIGLLEPREADEWIAKPAAPPSPGKGTSLMYRLLPHGDQPIPAGGCLRVVIPAGGVQDWEAW